MIMPFNSNIVSLQSLRLCGNLIFSFVLIIFIHLFSLRTFHMPMLDEELEELKKKQFVLETDKKIKWVNKMFFEWRKARTSHTR